MSPATTTTATASGVGLVDESALARAGSLRDRASSLRHQADTLPVVLADTYRRRASELELEAWIAEVQSGLPYDAVRTAA